MSINKEIKCTSGNNFKIPNFNRNFKKLCPTLFADKPITQVDITNIYETLSLIQEMAQLYSLEYKFNTIETLVEYISNTLSYIYKLEELSDSSDIIWNKIHSNFESYGNPFNYETYLSKLETEDYIDVSQYFFVNNIYNLLYLPRLKTESSNNNKQKCNQRDKNKLFDKKNRNVYLRLAQTISDDMLLSEKQILRHSKMPTQKKIIRKLLKNNKSA